MSWGALLLATSVAIGLSRHEPRRGADFAILGAIAVILTAVYVGLIG